MPPKRRAEMTLFYLKAETTQLIIELRGLRLIKGSL